MSQNIEPEPVQDKELGILLIPQLLAGLLFQGLSRNMSYSHGKGTWLIFLKGFQNCQGPGFLF